MYNIKVALGVWHVRREFKCLNSVFEESEIEIYKGFLIWNLMVHKIHVVHKIHLVHMVIMVHKIHMMLNMTLLKLPWSDQLY